MKPVTHSLIETAQKMYDPVQLPTLDEEVLEEGSIENEIKKIAKATDRNDHTGARILAAKLIKDKKLEKAYNAIEELITYFGHLPMGISELRMELDKRLRFSCEKKFDKATCQQIHMSM